jgi:hypothetical protein
MAWRSMRCEPLIEDWIQLRRDADAGIESVHVHFRGHAYDPHDHDEALVGITQQGVQELRCQRYERKAIEAGSHVLCRDS